MIGHDAVGQDSRRMLLGAFFEHALEGGIVLILFKESKSRDGPIETVVDETTGGDARTSRHGGSLIRHRFFRDKELRPGACPRFPSPEYLLYSPVPLPSTIHSLGIILSIIAHGHFGSDS